MINLDQIELPKLNSTARTCLLVGQGRSQSQHQWLQVQSQPVGVAVEEGEGVVARALWVMVAVAFILHNKLMLPRHQHENINLFC